MKIFQMLCLSTFLIIFSIGISYGQEQPSWEQYGSDITDGCSVPQFAVEVSPEIQRVTKMVRDCCVTHDKAYYEGNQPESEERIKADRVLKKCMQDKKEPGWAQAFYLSVRVGGCSVKKQPYRWGFGEDWVLEKGKPVSKPQYSQEEVKQALLLPCLGK